MGIQGSLENLMKAFITFYLICLAIGRPDIPFKVVAQLRARALAGTSVGWGCPSVFNKSACREYDSKKYK